VGRLLAVSHRLHALRAALIVLPGSALRSTDWWLPRGPCAPSARAGFAPRMRDLEIIDSELRLVAALRRAARERGGPLPSIDVADALLDERRELDTGK
jgi:hypothetical protein